MSPTPLHAQYVTPAPPETKIRLALLSKAMADALGGPAEFRRRFSYDTISTMIPNEHFRLPPGVWTDDTTMALCLAHSLATSHNGEGGFDEHDQMKVYGDWKHKGFLSATGECFDIGATVSGAISVYARATRKEAFGKIKEQFDDEAYSGNGSLMRVLPVGLAYWRDEEQARELARRSSVTTHPNELCQEACEVWTGAICRIMKAATSGSELSKLQLLEYFAQFPYKNTKLREALSLPPTAPPVPDTEGHKERYYRSHHPILKLLNASESFLARRQSKLIPHIPEAKQLPSSGYVLHSIVAALYTFLATSSYEQGAIFAANLGDDADTVAAIYGGLAGCWYAHEQSALPVGSVKFWTESVQRWKQALVARETVEGVADELVSFSTKLVERS